MDYHERDRICAAKDLDELDVGHRVKFNRLPSDDLSRPIINGKLLRIEDVTYLHGPMRKRGVQVTVGFPRQYGGHNIETYGPLPLHHQVTVGPVMRDRPDPFTEEAYLPRPIVAPQPAGGEPAGQ